MHNKLIHFLLAFWFIIICAASLYFIRANYSCIETKSTDAENFLSSSKVYRPLRSLKRSMHSLNKQVESPDDASKSTQEVTEEVASNIDEQSEDVSYIDCTPKENSDCTELVYTTSNMHVESDPELSEDLILMYIVDETTSGETLSESELIEVEECTDSEVLYYTEDQYREYPIACQVWQIMRSWGWSEPVCAGILGNMMLECGGISLNLDPYIYDPNYKFYGLCQWSLYWVPSINGLDVDSQMKHLYDTIQVNMSYFGGNFEDFLNIEYPGYAATYFQKFYEVGPCSELRYNCALYAYEYFRTIGD